MPCFKSFLCFKLETGGKIVAWFGMISNGLTLTMLSAFLTFVIGSPCEMFKENLQKILPIPVADDFQCFQTKLQYGVIILLIIQIFIGCFYLNFALLEGIKRNYTSQIVPAVIIGVISSIVFAFRMADFSSIQGFSIDSGMFAVQIYFLAILLSILRKICLEKRLKVDVAFPTGSA